MCQVIANQVLQRLWHPHEPFILSRHKAHLAGIQSFSYYQCAYNDVYAGGHTRASVTSGTFHQHNHENEIPHVHVLPHYTQYTHISGDVISIIEYWWQIHGE